MKKLISLAALAATLATPALASAFWPGTVINIADDDVLNVRKWPASYSQTIFEHDDGDHISLTGRCKNTVTNVSFYVDGGQSAQWKYNRMKKANVWCQTMTPDARLGWVRGKYVWPQ